MIRFLRFLDRMWPDFSRVDGGAAVHSPSVQQQRSAPKTIDTRAAHRALAKVKAATTAELMRAVGR